MHGTDDSKMGQTEHWLSSVMMSVMMSALGSMPMPVTVTFATIKEAQAAFLACERLRIAGRWPGQDWARAGHEAELAIHYALKEFDAHDF